MLEFSAGASDFSSMLPSPAFQSCPEDLWARLCSEDPSCTFYQTPAWLSLTCGHLRAQGGGLASVEMAPWLFATEQGPVVLPLLRRRRLGAWFYFSPFGTYTAPIARHALSPETKAIMLAALARVNIQLTSSPFTPNAIQVGQPLDYAIQVIDLARLDQANPMRDWEEGQRRRLRVSLRSEVTVRPAQSEADWRRYFELYEESLGRWGDKATMAHPWSLFDALRRRFANDPAMILWLAEVPEMPGSGQGAVTQGTAVQGTATRIGAGYLTFYHHQHAVPWHGAGGKDFFRFGVTQALFHRIILDAKSRGFRWLDLTGSSGLSGVAAFKSSFGTQDMHFQGSLHRVGLYGALSGLLARIKSRMPARETPSPTATASAHEPDQA